MRLKTTTIKERIQEKGGLNKIAKEIGLKYSSTLANWLNRKRYPVIYTRRLAKALGISTKTLLLLIEKEAKEGKEK